MALLGRHAAACSLSRCRCCPAGLCRQCHSHRRPEDCQRPAFKDGWTVCAASPLISRRPLTMQVGQKHEAPKANGGQVSSRAPARTCLDIGTQAPRAHALSRAGGRAALQGRRERCRLRQQAQLSLLPRFVSAVHQQCWSYWCYGHAFAHLSAHKAEAGAASDAALGRRRGRRGRSPRRRRQRRNAGRGHSWGACSCAGLEVGKCLQREMVKEQVYQFWRTAKVCNWWQMRASPCI